MKRIYHVITNINLNGDTMKIRLLLLIVIFTGMMSGTASGAIGIDSVSCDPDTSELVSGTVVQASVTMVFMKSSTDQPGHDSVNVSTDLCNPTWTVAQITAGVPPTLLSTMTGGTLLLPADGGLPDENGKLTFLVTVKGTAPVVISPEMKNILVITDRVGYNTIAEPRLIVPGDENLHYVPLSPVEEPRNVTTRGAVTVPAHSGSSPGTVHLSGNPVPIPEKNEPGQDNSGYFNGIVSAIKNLLKYFGI